MKYLICESQDGEGCDMRYFEKEADSIEELKESLLWPDGKDEYSTLEGDMPFLILIIPFDSITKVDIDKEREVVKSIRDKEEKDEIEEKEKIEYERLKNKYDI